MAGCFGGLWIIAIIILALAVSLVLNLKGHRFVAMLIGGAMVCGIASWYVDLNAHRFTAPIDAGAIRASGTVSRVSESLRSTRLLVNLAGRYHGSCYIRVVRSHIDFREGDVVDFTVEFQPPVVREDIDGEDLMERFFFLNHVGAMATVSGDNIAVTGVNKNPLWRLKRFKERIIDLIASTSLNASTQGFLTILLTGDDSMLFDDTRSRFAAAGIAHVLALSGLHVAVIAMILSLCLFPLIWLGYNRLRSIGIVILLWVYAIMTGLSPSVVRAVLMFTLIILARYTGRRYSSLNALCFAAFIIAIITPRCIFSAGYQLTVVATASLIVLPQVIELSRGNSKVIIWFQSYVLYTLAAFLGTLLLSLWRPRAS